MKGRESARDREGGREGEQETERGRVTASDKERERGREQRKSLRGVNRRRLWQLADCAASLHLQQSLHPPPSHTHTPLPPTHTHVQADRGKQREREGESDTLSLSAYGNFGKVWQEICRAAAATRATAHFAFAARRCNFPTSPRPLPTFLPTTPLPPCVAAGKQQH